MKKVYVLLAALIMGATMLVQASPLEKKEVKTNVSGYSVQQEHRPMHHRRVIHHRRHHRPHHTTVVVHH